MKNKEKGPEYYNKVYSQVDNKYSTKEIPEGYIELWKAVTGFLNKDHYILDVGCGVGQFAAYLHSLGFEKYTGIDFSIQALKKASKWVPDYNFLYMDVFHSYFNTFMISWMNVYPSDIVCLETLEHVKRDRELINSFSGNHLIFSVPNFDCASHVRYFKSRQEVEQRYGGLIQIKDYKFINNTFHLINCTVK